MKTSQPRKARVYDRLEGHEELPRAPRRWAEVDSTAQSLRPGALVALAFECDELLAARRSHTGTWSLATRSTEWSSRGTSGWHTHALDYAVESLEPECLFRVLRDGPSIALASVAADGQLLCTNASDRLGLVDCSNGQWAAAGASWEQRNGEICNSKWPDKILAVHMLHITALPTMQLQRCEEYYGMLLHEMHAEKATAVKAAKEMEEERDASAAEALRWRRQLEEVQDMRQQGAYTPAADRGVQVQPAAPHPDVSAQLAALQQQLENLALEGASSLPQLHQERARMSICLQTIRDITRALQSTTPSSNGSPSLDLPPGGRHSPTGAAARGDTAAAEAYGQDVEAESRLVDAPPQPPLVDYLGRRPEQCDPLDRVLEGEVSPGSGGVEPPESTPQRVLRALENADSFDSAPNSGLKPVRAPPAPLAESLSLAVRNLALGSPHEAQATAQYMATGGNMRASHARLTSQVKLKSSFLQRPPAAAEDLFYSLR